MYIRLRKKVSNEKAYEVTQVRPWSQTIKIRQMKWFRYLIRLPDKNNNIFQTTFFKFCAVKKNYQITLQ